MITLRAGDPLAVALVAAIRGGDAGALERLLKANPGLASARIGEGGDSPSGCGGSRTLLHLATDWPGHYPNGAATIRALIAAGADANARFGGTRHSETPLHWAASSDDLEALDALLDLGADLEADGGVIGGGTPLADAVAFGQWKAARRLVERGARTTLWQAAALGLIERVEERFAGEKPSPEEVTNAFWCACHGGQRATAEYLLGRGADLNWRGHDGLTPLDAARREGAGEVAQWLLERGGKSAKEEGRGIGAPRVEK